MDRQYKLPQLSRDLLARVGSLRFPVAGNSMSPVLEPGDIAVVEPMAEGSPRAGEVLLVFINDRQPTAHRLIARYRRDGRLLLALKGDRAGAWDPVLSEAAVVGRVTSVEREQRVLPVACRPPSFMDRLRGWRHVRRALREDHGN